MTKRRRSGVANWLSESATPVFVLDERRVVLFFNQGCEALTGWAPADVVGKTCDYATSPDPTQVESLTGSLCPPPDIWDHSHVVAPGVLHHRDGTVLNREVHYFPLTFGPEEPRRLVGVILPAGQTVSPNRETASPELHAQLATVRSRLWETFRIDTIIAESPAMHRVMTQVQLAIPQPIAVHFSGPIGTGREFLARAIHYQGPRRVSAFVPLDCATMSPFEIKRTLRRLLELPKGEDPEAPSLRAGAVFLRNVTSMVRDAQQWIVDRLQELSQSAATSTVEPIRWFSSDARPLSEAVTTERLLPELYYHLTPLVIDVPALRDRMEDLPLLGQFLLERINRDTDKQLGGFTPEAWDRLRKYQWPGNVRELQSVIAEAHTAAKGPLVTATDLPFRFRTGFDAQLAGPPQVPIPIDLEALLHAVERREIQRALRESRFNKSRTAELLGLTRPRLYRRMEQLGIDDIPSSEEPAASSPVDTDRPPDAVEKPEVTDRDEETA